MKRSTAHNSPRRKREREREEGQDDTLSQDKGGELVVPSKMHLNTSSSVDSLFVRSVYLVQQKLICTLQRVTLLNVHPVQVQEQEYNLSPSILHVCVTLVISQEIHFIEKKKILHSKIQSREKEYFKGRIENIHERRNDETTKRCV